MWSSAAEPQLDLVVVVAVVRKCSYEFGKISPDSEALSMIDPKCCAIYLPVCDLSTRGSSPEYIVNDRQRKLVVTPSRWLD